MSNNFNPGFDREKAAFLELANRGDGLAPIEYLYAEEARFGSVLSSVITGGTAELYTIYVNGIESSNITNTEDIITNSLKLSNQLNDYYVGFTAGSLTQSTIWTLPLQDGSNGQVLATDGNGSLSFIDAGGGGSGGGVTSITAGTGLSGGTITTSGTISLANTTVTAGNYTNASITVNAQGQLTAASSSATPAPRNATYILQTSDSSLPNAQALNGLGTGIAKITGG